MRIPTTIFDTATEIRETLRRNSVDSAGTEHRGIRVLLYARDPSDPKDLHMVQITAKSIDYFVKDVHGHPSETELNRMKLEEGSKDNGSD